MLINPIFLSGRRITPLELDPYCISPDIRQLTFQKEKTDLLNVGLWAVSHRHSYACVSLHRL